MTNNNLNVGDLVRVGTECPANLATGIHDLVGLVLEVNMNNPYPYLITWSNGAAYWGYSANELKKV